MEGLREFRKRQLSRLRRIHTWLIVFRFIPLRMQIEVKVKSHFPKGALLKSRRATRELLQLRLSPFV